MAVRRNSIHRAKVTYQMIGERRSRSKDGKSCTKGYKTGCDWQAGESHAPGWQNARGDLWPSHGTGQYLFGCPYRVTGFREAQLIQPGDDRRGWHGISCPRAREATRLHQEPPAACGLLGRVTG